jgi:hypothetical protein
MFPQLFQPFFSIARANAEAYLRVSASIAESMRQLSEVNRDAIRRTLAGPRPQWGNDGAAHPAPFGLLPLWPDSVADYTGEVLATVNTAAKNILDAISASSPRDAGDAPALVIASASQPAAPVVANAASVIVDESGNVVKP